MDGEESRGIFWVWRIAILMDKRETMSAILIELIVNPDSIFDLSQNVKNDLLDEHMRLINVEREAIKVVTEMSNSHEELQEELLQLTAFRFRRNIPPVLIY
jgi:hypothetical protein